MNRELKAHAPTCIALESECTACGGCKGSVLDTNAKTLSQNQKEGLK